jgi:hypothetical protein
MALTFVVLALYGVFAATVRTQVISRPKVMLRLRRTFAATYVLLAGWILDGITHRPSIAARWQRPVSAAVVKVGAVAGLGGLAGQPDHEHRLTDPGRRSAARSSRSPGSGSSPGR